MARPREPWKRQRLVDVAMTQMREKGVGAVTVKELAHAAGVSTATVHYHFADADGVLREVVEHALEQVYTGRLEAIAPITGLTEKLLTLIELGIPDVVSVEVSLLYETGARMRADAQFRPLLRSYVERQVSIYRSVIDAGRATGDFALTAASDDIARNLVALEDAYCLYLVMGIDRDGVGGRRAARSYAASALGLSSLGE